MTVFTMFLKRYLGINYGTRSCLLHILPGTKPLTHSILENAQERVEKIEKINLSFNVEHREILVVTSRERGPLPKYNPIEIIPTGFWVSEVMNGSLPASSYYRYRTGNKILDGNHDKICQTKEFHYNHSQATSKCQFCNEPAEWFHKCIEL